MGSSSRERGGKRRLQWQKPGTDQHLENTNKRECDRGSSKFETAVREGERESKLGQWLPEQGKLGGKRLLCLAVKGYVQQVSAFRGCTERREGLYFINMLPSFPSLECLLLNDRKMSLLKSPFTVVNSTFK